MVNANNQEGYSSDTTTPGLNDGEKIPTSHLMQLRKKEVKFVWQISYPTPLPLVQVWVVIPLQAKPVGR